MSARAIVYRLILATSVAAFFGACAWLAQHPDRVRFSHKKHVVDEGTGCEDCHDGVAENTSLDAARSIPGKEACGECHEDELEDDCGYCHENPKAPAGFGRSVARMEGVRFSHAAHADRAGDGCKACHAEVEQAKTAAVSHRPTMRESCAGCHDKDFDRQDCLACHKNLVDTEQAPLSMFAHKGDWLRRHGEAAQAGGEGVCGHCHKSSTCAECHASTRPFPSSQGHLDRPGREAHHRGDFRTRHAIEARLDPQSCRKCHDVQTDCASCHERMGASGGSGRSPHPAAWMQHGAASFHGKEARRDIASCASCHGDGSAAQCLQCHRPGAYGGSPHPPGFDAGGRERRSDPGCTPCH